MCAKTTCPVKGRLLSLPTIGALHLTPTKTVNKKKTFRAAITKSLPEIKIIVHYVLKIVLIHSPHWRTVLFKGLVRKRKQIENIERETHA
jgi:hypothetical protein